MKRKLLALLLCVTVVFSLGACGNGAARVTKLAEYDDLEKVLSGDYVITEEVLGMYFTEMLGNAGVGIIEVTDRDTVQEGDIVLTDYTGYKDDVAFEGGEAKNQWIDVSNNCAYDVSKGMPVGGFITGFTKGLVGAKIEQAVRSDVKFPNQYHSAELAGQPAVFEFLVHKIYIPVTQENITDDFVKENLSDKYNVSTVAEFMEFLEEDLAYNYIMNYLIANSTVEIPEDYLNRRLKDYETYFEELYCQGTTLEEYLAYYGYTLEAQEVEWKTSLEGQIIAESIFENVVKEKNLKLDEKAHKEYVENITAVNSKAFPNAESIYKYAGAGNAKTGKKYLKTQTAVREYMIEKYRSAIAE